MAIINPTTGMPTRLMQPQLSSMSPVVLALATGSAFEISATVARMQGLLSPLQIPTQTTPATSHSQVPADSARQPIVQRHMDSTSTRWNESPQARVKKGASRGDTVIMALWRARSSAKS